MTITPDDAEVITDAIESALIDVHTSLPGKVQAYDATTQTADIELQVKRALPKDDGTYATEDLPVLVNVPVAFMRAGGHMLTMPIAAGDFGQVIFSEMSIDQWRSKGANTSPGDIGRHTLTGGVFYPGLSPVTQPIQDDISGDAVFGAEGGVQVRSKGASIDITSPGNTVADDFVAMANKIDTIVSAIDSVIRTTWIVVAMDGGAALKAAWLAADFGAGPALPPGTTASSNLKADD